MAGVDRFSLMFAAPFIGIGLVFVVVGWVMILLQAGLVSRAVPAPGLVESSGVVTWISVRGADSHAAQVQYRYLYEDEIYTSDVVFPHTVRTSSRGAMARVARRFPPDAEITVWVDPLDPDNAFLLKELLWLPYVFALAPIVFIVIGAAVILPWRWLPLPIALPVIVLWWHHAHQGEAIPWWMLALYGTHLAAAAILVGLALTWWLRGPRGATPSSNA